MSYLKYPLCLVGCLWLEGLAQASVNQVTAVEQPIWHSEYLKEDIYIQLSQKASYNPWTKLWLAILFTPPINGLLQI